MPTRLAISRRKSIKLAKLVGVLSELEGIDRAPTHPIAVSLCSGIAEAAAEKKAAEKAEKEARKQQRLQSQEGKYACFFFC